MALIAGHRVVIIGGGFAGLYAAKGLAKAPVQVTLVDRRNFHLFQPLLYQVATGALSPANIAAPLRGLLRRQSNTRVLMAEATDFDLARRCVKLSDGEIEYDTLIVAPGSQHHYFAHSEWEDFAPSLKTIEDATDIRSRIFGTFEQAELAGDARDIADCLTFVIVGGGPTGVELAGAIAEIARGTLARDYRSIQPAGARILLLEAADRILPTYPPELSRRAEAALAKLGVEVQTGAMVSAIDGLGVETTRGGQSQHIGTRTVLWAAGVRASGLGVALARAAGIETDRQGRLAVGADLALAGHPEVLILGDLARVEQDGAPLPGVAPVAMQQGGYAARLIEDRLAGRPTPPFRYRDRGTMATIGRSAAVADLRWFRLSGLAGWLAWLFIHILYLAGFQNRLLVVTQWAWNYFTHSRSARLITASGRAVARRGRREDDPI
jgi:NADH dehydrogenase